MDAFSTFELLFRDLLLFVAAMAALLVALIVAIARLPNSNPLKRLLTALSWRVGATLAAGVLAIPLEPIPGVDALYDVGAPLALLWYWWTFIRDARRPRGPAPGVRAPRNNRPNGTGFRI